MLPIKDCTGCSACAHVCPKGCISMIANEHGFLYPQINNDICVECGACKKNCPVLNKTATEKSEEIISYAAKTTDETIRKCSSSGGIFSAIAKKVIENNGIVYGAAFDGKFVVKHISVSSLDDLDLLRRSKYVQSDLNNSFVSVKNNLTEGKTVLFTGTPCQVEGLLAYLKKPYDNLITMDFVCHGVPSPNVWEYYKTYLQKQYKSAITDVNFRDKTLGWKNSSIRIEFENSNVYCNLFRNDPYMNAFLANMDLRESCYTCKFKSVNHKSDITVADYWGIDKTNPEIDDDKGLSLVLINSDKGASLLNVIESSLTLTKTDVEKTFQYNPCIIKPAKKHSFSQYFLNNYRKGDFAKVVDSCLNPSYITRLKRKFFQRKTEMLK
ncbi:MAG: Coenzyme F420 hydrogenase/dehydrogenase, beta subunit C-terminal domain [Clostridia bacterium]|nr:Coenzyme F420 hydrogenase/dehydrogenase, beta subunit C-terminal domain [Clostridia bacterium]